MHAPMTTKPLSTRNRRPGKTLVRLSLSSTASVSCFGLIDFSSMFDSSRLAACMAWHSCFDALELFKECPTSLTPMQIFVLEICRLNISSRITKVVSGSFFATCLCICALACRVPSNAVRMTDQAYAIPGLTLHGRTSFILQRGPGECMDEFRLIVALRSRPINMM